MIKLRIVALAAILLGPSAALYAAKGWKAERTLPAALCAQSLLLILLGYVLPFSFGVGILAAISAAAWAWALWRVKSVKNAAGFFSVPCLLFLIAIPILYHACAKRIYISYDEHSHWGLIVKLITVFNELPRAGRGAPLLMFTYPPAGAMLPAMAGTLLGYRDGVANFGYGLLIVGMMTGLAPEDAGRERHLAMPLAFLTIMAIFPLGFLRMFSEPVIALLAALLLVPRGGTRTRWDDAFECLYAAMLAMMKNTGMVILALVLLARLIARRERGEGKRLLRLLLCGAIAAGSYAIYCRVQGIGSTHSPSHFTENLRALLSGTTGEVYRTVPARFIQFFFGHALSQAGVYTCYGFGTTATVCAFVLLLCVVHVFVAEDRKTALRLWAGVWAANAVYTLTIVASYFFFFEEWEVARLSEADRYMMLPALWTALAFCAAILGEADAAHARRRCAAVCLVALVLVPLSHPEMSYNTFITQDYARRTVWARDEADRQDILLRGQLSGEENAKLLCMGGYDYVSLHYLLCDMLDIGDIGASWSDAPWQGDCEAVRDELVSGGYTHVFVADLSGDTLSGPDRDLTRAAIDERYAPLTPDGEPLRAQSLYRVERSAQDGISLAYVASIPEMLE